MSRKPLALLVSIIALGFAGSALAQTSSTPAPDKKKVDRAKWEKNFKDADKNGDGALSKDELNAAKGFPGVKKNFDAIDANKDGKVTIAEHQAWQSQRAAQKAAKPGTTK